MTGARTGQQEELLAELKTLRKGRGVNTARIADQVGPRLRALVGVTPEDPAGTIRQKLTRTLTGLADPLPKDLSLAARAALALHPEAQQPFLAERVQWLAERLDRDVRTARRRVDLGLQAMAERSETAAVPPSGPPPSDADLYYFREFRAVLRLDQPAPEAIEQRVAVSTVDGLDQLEALITIPRDRQDRPRAQDLLVEALFGVTVASRERVTPSRFRYVLQLPRPLAAGEAYEYALLFRLPPDQPMRNHYVYAPTRRCDLFDLRVRFDPARVPPEVWRVDRGYVRDLDEDDAPRELVEVDRAGELHLQFQQLRPGLGYGAGWRPAPSYQLRHGVS